MSESTKKYELENSNKFAGDSNNNKFKNVRKSKSKVIEPTEQNDTAADISQSHSVHSQIIDEDIATVPNTVELHTTEGDGNHSSESSTNLSVCDDFEALDISTEIHDEAKEKMSDDEDDSFFNDELFAKTNTTTVPTETFPCQDDSDSEMGAFEKDIRLFIDESRSVAVAEFDDTEYRIGFLDLTDNELTHLKLISQTSVLINMKPSSIFIDDNKFNIKRIYERQITPNIQSIDSIEKYMKLNLDRIQFSSQVPLAKYKNEIYLVGPKLHSEYKRLLDRTLLPAGTPIRINSDRLEIDVATQTLELHRSISVKNRSEVCVVKGSFDSNEVLSNHCMNGYRRFVICNNSSGFEIYEVDSELLHSSIYDDYTEIYAELDFPFSSSEKVSELVKQISISFRPKTLAEKPFYDPEDEPLEMQTLQLYEVPKILATCTENNRHPLEALKKTSYNDLLMKKSLRENMNDYINGSRMMLHLEERANTLHLKKFNQTNIKLTYYWDRQFYFPITEHLTELSAAIEENVLDYLVLHPKLSGGREKDVYGKVLRIRERKIIIEIFDYSFRLIKYAYKKEVYDIEFLLNRQPYKMQHYALDFVKQENLFTKLINNSYYKCKTAALTLANGQNNKKNHKFQVEGTLLQGLNHEQRVAVENIITKTDKLPYVLFGPPGTGKTRTLVAAIEQIVRTTKQNVLVCAMSNAACDEITDRLIDVLDESELYRFYAKSHQYTKISARIGRVSNFGSDGIFYPSLEYLYKFRVFVCTLCSAGCLTRARKDIDVWKANHFSYVFIDESASAHETMCLIPIAGLCTSTKEIHAKIILAGDPKQLDAVTRSDVARKLKFNTSWLERLCDSNLYKRNDGKFNEVYITQLVRNYRSHPEILRILNELFYENTLQPCADPADINQFIGSNILPSKNFPVIFKSVQGKCERSIEHSWYNEQEIDEVVRYIKMLLPSLNDPKNSNKPKVTAKDIGVVTPYRKQRHKIVQKLRTLRFDEVTVGTAEVFQGQERPIIILSTVRSNGALGFVSEPRRLNVIITRAKCLLIIFGDPHTLSLDGNWRRVIDHCIRNNSFIQSNKKFSSKK